MFKLDKKKKRSLAYVGIVGGCAVLALTFFTICQYQKAKYKASDTMRITCKGSYDSLSRMDIRNLDPTDPSDAAVLEQHNNLVEFWKQATKDFTVITAQNAGAYKGTAIPAYLFSMATLVSFGLVLKDAEKVKEQEEKEV